MGDFNAEVTETSMQQFCESYFLENVVKKPTCFKNPAEPTCIDMIITNKRGMFQSAKTYETDLSDFHKLVVSIMKLSYKKRSVFMMHFKNSLNENLANNTELDYNSFGEIILNLLSSRAPFKKKNGPGNSKGIYQ